MHESPQLFWLPSPPSQSCACAGCGGVNLVVTWFLDCWLCWKIWNGQRWKELTRACLVLMSFAACLAQMFSWSGSMDLGIFHRCLSKPIDKKTSTARLKIVRAWAWPLCLHICLVLPLSCPSSRQFLRRNQLNRPWTPTSCWMEDLHSQRTLRRSFEVFLQLLSETWLKETTQSASLTLGAFEENYACQGDQEVEGLIENHRERVKNDRCSWLAICLDVKIKSTCQALFIEEEFHEGFEFGKQIVSLARGRSLSKRHGLLKIALRSQTSTKRSFGCMFTFVFWQNFFA